MAPKNRIIIDTDPGVDDILAILLALSASPADVEVLLLSVTFGNVPVQRCLRNIVAMFNVLEKEFAWRKAHGKALGFDALRASKPLVAVGADHPLEEDELAADHFHGHDGLHGVHDEHPHLSPEAAWGAAFREGHGERSTPALFTPSKVAAHQEILRLLRESPVNTITIVAVGPLTNLALAAAEEPITFLRVKEVIAMGGTIDLPGNITPNGEFNIYADPVAAARVFALTSPRPYTSMPVTTAASTLPPYPDYLSRKLKLTLFPLDITTPHRLFKGPFTEKAKPLEEAGSPLAQWTGHFMSRTFAKIESLKPSGSTTEAAPELEDIRVETSGQWTRGMCVVDRRGIKKAVGLSIEADESAVEELVGDTGGWLGANRGNQIRRVVESPGEDLFGEILLKNIFG
ncbi:inosine-uridine preferring nucleoside hydrolase [Colletotrichum phormii]|uniref:Inosine-uridine preferring nucleoside hydrolase n=1 Tax=Colletotrichum phormii TaxID=359342 RepID=A0AAI9ZDY1_9PEZI|nr:inosine-uridine preferring nucleoside hydrolase [Colletotrichum phormii]KAK1622782.1 inosine-uridine preferring nucleoside hydrolase [Colletotrichum phormii]